jgi:hypothetical protein
MPTLMLLFARFGPQVASLRISTAYVRLYCLTAKSRERMISKAQRLPGSLHSCRISVPRLSGEVLDPIDQAHGISNHGMPHSKTPRTTFQQSNITPGQRVNFILFDGRKLFHCTSVPNHLQQ